MEATVSNGGPLLVPSPQHPPRKEWRTVSEHSFHNNGGEEMEHVKFGQSDERTIYEVQEVTGPLDVDFCSITIDGGGLTDKTLQGRLEEVSRQREELEHLETELRAQAIARTETMEMQRRYQSQIREHVDATAQLKDLIKQKEQEISELKATLEEKDRELRSVKIDNEAVWAKEDLLRELNKELATFRRELDNSEVERARLVKQIHDLQEHVREKESQFLALEEQVVYNRPPTSVHRLFHLLHTIRLRLQWIDVFICHWLLIDYSFFAFVQVQFIVFNYVLCGPSKFKLVAFGLNQIEFPAVQIQFLVLRVARETVLYKDEQLREAQAWIARVQVDALQSTTNQSLQAELQERTEQFNQYWIALQRQFVEMERHHIQTIQQLHLELAEARGKSEIYKDGFLITHENSTDSSSHLQKKGHQMNATNDGISNSALTHPSNGKFSTSSSSINTEHASGVPVFPPLLGMSTFLPGGQMAAFRPFVMHPQGVPHSPSSTNSIISQSYLGNVLPTSPVPAQQYWLNHQVMLNQSKCNTSQLEPSQVGSDSHFSCQLSADGKVLQEYHLNSQNNQQQSSFPAINGSNEEIQVPEISSKQYQVPQKTQGTSVANFLLNAAFRCETAGQRSEHKDYSIASLNESQELVTTSSQQCLAAIIDADAAPSIVVGSNSAAEYNSAKLVSSETTIPTTHESSSVTTSKTMDHALLDERALLACIVRAIPAGSDGRIRISSTLPNRLGKMLAPLHWHDYKKHYGKLDDFVSHHPELFVIEGDFIHLREGAQEIISATAAVAKVAAAAAASSVSYSSLVPSVAVTPVSQSNRHKKSSVESKSVNSVSYLDDAAINNTQASYDSFPVNLKSPLQPQNGISFKIVQEIPDVTFSNKIKNSYGMNGLPTEMSTAQPTASNVVGNGSNRGLTNVRHVFGGKQQERSSGTGVISRR
ncbi:hypothetical protein IEQ34_004939 [Dendrobium chrysotoxum]|uniref:DUF7725 domain-containing protein n=1 Tax=Dendrobium chrysotoxum TaxID=161865 RepID=A0AAV7H6R6_DENCH|nr:hypothetical protein IEQ34_004939 [Dendrobium chrysotoxum]